MLSQRIFIIVVFAFGICNMSVAEIYNWADANGKIYFSDQKPQQQQTETLSPSINSYSNVSLGEHSSQNIIMYNHYR